MCMNGDKGCAYTKFKSIISGLIDFGDSGYNGILPIINADCHSLYELQPDELNYYFRISSFEDSIIHLPFHKLEFSRNDLRFSAKGIPCFYGGNNILTCINETGGVMNPNGLISCFEIDYTESALLDLTMPSFDILESHEKYLDRYILSWPLIALCMIRKKEVDGDQIVIPEYLIPMFTIRVLSGLEVAGIKSVRYYGTKSDSISDNHINIAIPVQTEGDYGYCHKLLDVFRDKDRDPVVSNHLRITKPKLLCELLSPANLSFREVEIALRNNITYVRELIGER
jgi:hypothetical protein